MDWEHFLNQHCGYPEKPLFHYTTLAGFKGILGSDSIWATDTRYLNDMEEYRHGVKLFQDELERLASEWQEHDFLKTYPECVGDFLHMAAHLDGKHTYCVSFTENGNLLSQWRGYAGDCGLSIGFDPVSLVEAAQKQGFRFVKCLYDEGEKRKLVHDVLDDFLWHYDQNHKNEAIAHFTPEHFGRDLRAMICFFAPVLKDEAFIEEAEWRAVYHYHVSQPILSSHLSGGQKIPHAVFSIKGVEIEKVFIGPCTDMVSASHELVSTFASRNLYQRYENPCIPYRHSLVMACPPPSHLCKTLTITFLSG